MKQGLHGFLALAAAICAPEAFHLRAGGGQRASYRQRLRNYQNVQYFGSLTVGGQELDGLFDTGSFELLVRSARCTNCVHPTAPYDWKKSRTFLANGKVKHHRFGSGPCVSMRGYEEVSLGPFRADQQAFYEIVSHEMPVLDRAAFAAIVGIGPNFGYNSTDDTLLMSFGVSEFSICLQKASGADGYITWGSTVDPAYKEAHYARARVIGNHHWVTHLQQVTAIANSRPEDTPCAAEGCAVIIDSGTSLIAAPLQGLQQLSRQIPPVNEDCSNLHELPTLHFQVDGIDLELPPRAYVLRMTGKVVDFDKIWDLLFFKPRYKTVNICVPAFMKLDMVSKFGPVWILGMPFLRYYHTTFDRERQEMYFARAGPDCFPQPMFTNNSTGGPRQLLQVPLRDEADGPLDVDVSGFIPPTESQGFVEL